MTSRTHTFKGRLITVTFDVGRCMHAAHCVKGLPAVFDRDRKPWVDPDQASATALMGVIERCPSGALKAQLGSGGRSAERPQRTNTVQVVADGPLYLRGQITLVADGAPEPLAEDVRLALCRCGRSKRAPFCDASHVKAGFRDPGVFTAPVDKPDDAFVGGPRLTVEVKPGGPLRATGDLQLLDAAGKPAGSAKGAVLCRCGRSKSKPFCDGSHRETASGSS
ncbi:MAG: CDGSH iron-sulfur domain-containing protein [Burkholderiales bacterium]|nr:CDGSH iron-sulfur domain-containing protein [Burkholderiales bacterium]